MAPALDHAALRYRLPLARAVACPTGDTPWGPDTSRLTFHASPKGGIALPLGHEQHVSFGRGYTNIRVEPQS